jgi:hypothetical protein
MVQSGEPHTTQSMVLPVGMGLPTGVVTGMWVGRVANCASSACACGMAFESAVADAEAPPLEFEVELSALEALGPLEEQAARSSSADDPIVATTVRKARRLVPKYTDTVTPVDWHEVVETPACRRFWWIVPTNRPIGNTANSAAPGQIQQADAMYFHRSPDRRGGASVLSIAVPVACAARASRVCGACQPVRARSAS